VYFAVGELSYRLSNLETVISGTFYLHEGYALALIAAFGLRTLPSVFIGHLALVLFQQTPLARALVSSIENVLVLAATLSLLRLMRFRADLARPKDFLTLIATSLLAFQLLSRIVGLLVLAANGNPASLHWADLPEFLTNGIADESICQVLIATTLLTSLDEVRRRRSLRYWCTGLAATAVLTACLAAVLWGKVGALNPLHVFSIIYLAVMAITFAFRLHGAAFANLVALITVQWAASVHAGTFYSLLASQEQEGSISTILIGVILSSSMVGALLREKQDREKALIELATHDALTGLFNRRYFFEAANRELMRARRQEVDILLMCLDLDHFKSINDTHGHATGDNVLAATGEILRSTLRRSDVAARMGGEEFTVLACDTHDAVMLGERLRLALQVYQAQHPELVNFTVSIGITRLRPDDEDMATALKRADDALYEAKHNGRDRVVVRH
jgi:diguanylate cyclase (GGDEF)-like protein